MARGHTPDPRLAVAYCRVSTEEQDIGPEVQEAAIRKWCAVNDVELLEPVCVDRGKSGGLELEKRPGLVQAIDAVKERRAGLLIVHKRDRLARDREVIGTIGMLLRKMGCRVQSTNHKFSEPEELDPMEKAMQGMEDVFAELERSMIRARTRAALQMKKARGERVGTIPYGFRLADDDVALVEEPREQEIVALVKKLRAEGASLRAIGRELHERGYSTRRGGEWHASTVKRIVDA